MIPRSIPEWQYQLRDSVTTVGELLQELSLPLDTIPGDREIQAATAQFPLRVPRSFVRRMRPGDPEDPLLLQVLPQGQEMASVPGFTKDPLAERNATPAPGLLHKYHGRVLLVLTGACGIHCRYCFRRHFPYNEATPGRDGWQSALDYLVDNPSISEVILSGGDPLTLSDQRLLELVAHLDTIPHLRRLRIHTRLPVVIPQRIDDPLLDALQGTRFQTVIVFHINHAQEIDESLKAAIRRLRHRDITVLNQAVLLRGINDRCKDLVALSEALFEVGVLPYYLHLLDPVEGAAHFAVEESTAQDLMGEVSRQLPGYLVPRLVKEIPGVAAKVPIDLEKVLACSSP